MTFTVRPLPYNCCVSALGEVKFGLSQKAKTKVWSKSKLKIELDLMSAIWSQTILKSKVWT